MHEKTGLLPGFFTSEMHCSNPSFFSSFSYSKFHYLLQPAASSYDLEWFVQCDKGEIMFLIDQWVEKHINDAQEKGEFENLRGSGRPLILDDDSAVPDELRTSYRILKNAGYLPPELQDRKEAIELDHLLNTLDSDDPKFLPAEKRLKVLQMRLQQAGMNTGFLHGHYENALKDKFRGK